MAGIKSISGIFLIPEIPTKPKPEIQVNLQILFARPFGALVANATTIQTLDCEPV